LHVPPLHRSWPLLVTLQLLFDVQAPGAHVPLEYPEQTPVPEVQLPLPPHVASVHCPAFAFPEQVCGPAEQSEPWKQLPPEHVPTLPPEQVGLLWCPQSLFCAQAQVPCEPPWHFSALPQSLLL
jgi:hypothetical protein